MADLSHLKRLEREMVDKGRLIEAGWIGCRLAALPLNTPGQQLEQHREFFFAGAQHLFSSIMSILDPEDEPTAADLERLDKIQGELDEFIQVFELRHFPAKGQS
jgi:hypothetical protein